MMASFSETFEASKWHARKCSISWC